MATDKLPADNPASGLFDLAEHMSDNYRKVKYLKYYAYIFVGITLLLLVIIALLLVAEGNIGIFIMFLALIICGVMIIVVRYTSRYFSILYHEYKLIP